MIQTQNGQIGKFFDVRVLVTGTAGRLGHAIAANLQPEHEVVGIDQCPSQFTTFVGSIGEGDLVRRAIEGCEAVIHTASLHAPHITTHSRRQFVATNVQGTLNLLEAAIECGVTRFVYSSTTSVYGRAMEDQNEAIWVTEELAPQPRDIYDVTKIAAENLCREIAESSVHLSCVSLRVSRFFPESDRLTAIYRLYRGVDIRDCLLYTSPSPRDATLSRMPSSA